MGVILHLDNRYATIKGASRNTIRVLEGVTSYKVAGRQYSPAFRAGRWDGREHLLKFSAKHGYRVPIGLLQSVIDTLEEVSVDFAMDTSKRGSSGPSIVYDQNADIKLRPYQIEAVESILEEDCWDHGLGILKMPIRSGKTKTAAEIIRRLGVRTIFIVPSQMLLYQAKESLEESLLTQVGLIGDGTWNEQVVTVATVQSLVKARGGVKVHKDGSKNKIPATPRYKELVKRYDCVVYDEAHHLRGDIWHKVMMDLDATYRIGLSATPLVDNDSEQERGAIWLTACCGDIAIDIPTSKLIEEGYLLRQQIELYAITTPYLHNRAWSQGLRNEAIYENVVRNRKIATCAQSKVSNGLKVLIISNRLNQIALLSELLTDLKLRHHTITGEDSSGTRKKRVADFVNGAVDILLGTVFSEGVDIPAIECVINAEGGRDVKASVQRMRNLTPAEGKVEAVFVDYMDMTNAYFAQHSAERLAAYKSEPAFLITLIE